MSLPLLATSATPATIHKKKAPESKSIGNNYFTSTSPMSPSAATTEPTQKHSKKEQALKLIKRIIDFLHRDENSPYLNTKENLLQKLQSENIVTPEETEKLYAAMYHYDKSCGISRPNKDLNDLMKSERVLNAVLTLFCEGRISFLDAISTKTDEHLWFITHNFFTLMLEGVITLTEARKYNIPEKFLIEISNKTTYANISSLMKQQEIDLLQAKTLCLFPKLLEALSNKQIQQAVLEKKTTWSLVVEKVITAMGSEISPFRGLSWSLNLDLAEKYGLNFLDLLDFKPYQRDDFSKIIKLVPEITPQEILKTIKEDKYFCSLMNRWPAFEGRNGVRVLLTMTKEERNGVMIGKISAEEMVKKYQSNTGFAIM